MSLAGKTLFITGASRGIGLAIALRAARDGANIAIAAKTEKPHPKLPGTIYTAADEVERAGGKALPLVLDVCDEAMAKAALAQAANRFGGMTFTREGEANPKSGMSQTVILRGNNPQDRMSALPPKADIDRQTFRRRLDMIVTSKVLKFAGHHHETSPQTIFAFGRGRCGFAGRFAHRIGARLPGAAGAYHCGISCRQRA